MHAVHAHDYRDQERADPKSLVVVALSPEYAAVAMFRFAAWLMNTPLRPLGWLVHLFNRYLTASDISPFADIGPGFRLAHATGVVIGDHVVAGRRLTVFNDVNLGARLRGGRVAPDDGMPVVGEGVFVGAGARVLGPIVIGDHAIIGANAVVVHDVDACVTVGGIPARPIGA